jgi:beta-lactamase regulating signal transducer with metallopeptidase domain/protocatechuate 3,4-dioxygenase beta subunit
MFSHDLHEWFAGLQHGAAWLALSLILQSTVLIVLGLWAGRAVRRKGAAVQSVVYRTTLAAVLLCPAVSWLLLAAGLDGLMVSLPTPAPVPHEVARPPESTNAVEPNRAEALPGLAASDDAARSLEGFDAAPGDAAIVPAPSADRPFSPKPARPVPDRAAPSPPETNAAAVLACVLTVAWPIVSGLLLLRLLVAYGLMARVRRQARQAEPQTISHCQALAARLGVRAPALLRSPRATSPCLFGLLRPAILLPDEHENPVSNEILVHELAHLARHDCLWNLIGRVSLAVLFFQPLLWVLSRRMVRASEEVCDDYVLGLGFDSRDYARRLADVAEQYTVPLSAAAVTVVSVRSWLGRRVERILDSSRKLSTRAGRRTVAAMGIVGIASTMLVGLLGVGGTRAEEAPTLSAVNTRPIDDDKPAGKTEPAQRGVSLSARGTVVDAEGKPVAGAKVYLREWSRLRVSENPYDENPRDVLATAQTAADGTFRFNKVPAPPFARDWSYEAPWDVVAVADGHGMAWRHLGRPEEKAPMTLTLPPEAKLTGRLVDGQGRPVAGVEVRLHELAGLGSRIRDFRRLADHLDLGWSQLTPRAQPDAEGRFAIGGLPPEMRATLVAEHDQYAREVIYAATTDRPQSDLEYGSLSPEGERRQTTRKVHTGDFTVQLKPGLHVRGRVLFADTKRPCPGAKAMLSLRNRALYQIADAQGRFAFNGLSEPEWYVSASSPQQGDYLRRRVHVALREAEREAEVQIELPRGQVVTGSVVGEDTHKGVPGVGVYFWDEVPDDAPDRLYALGATTDERGMFRVAVPSGRGLLVIFGPVEGYDLPRSPIPPRVENPNPRFVRQIEVKPGEPVPEVRFTVGRGLVITGQITDPEGKPVAGAEVKTLPSPGNDPSVDLSTRTDADGRFTLAGLPAMKELWLNATHRQRRLIRRLRVETTGHGEGTEPVTVDIQLEPAAAVRGRVLVDGQPVAGLPVSLMPSLALRNEMYMVSVDTVKTGEAGRFEFDLVPPCKACWVECFDMEFTDLPGRTFPLEPGQTQELPTLELRRKSMSVSGIVVDPDGNPVEGVRVSANERNGRPIRGAFTERPTGKDGRFTIRGVPNVPLQIMAWIPNPPDSKDRRIRFPARVDVMPGQKDLRIVLDPRLGLGQPE